MTVDINARAQEVHKNNEKWWIDLNTGVRFNRNKGEMLALVVSEISEALEGERKNLMDDHLPNRKMAEVEMADAYIRMLDFTGGFGYEIFQESLNNITTNSKTNKFEELMDITVEVVRLYLVLEYGEKYDINAKITDIFVAIAAYCQKYGYDLEGAFQQKNEYNKTRADHSREARLGVNGKKN